MYKFIITSVGSYAPEVNFGEAPGLLLMKFTLYTHQKLYHSLTMCLSSNDSIKSTAATMRAHLHSKWLPKQYNHSIHNQSKDKKFQRI